LNLFKDFNVNIALTQIAASMDTYAEMLRLDPFNLVSDSPYNDLIFRTQVNATFLILFNLFKVFNREMSSRSNAICMLSNSLVMVHSLKRIAHYYFTEAQNGSPNIAVLLEIDFQFHAGCDLLSDILRAAKNKIINNSCYCLINDVFCQ